MTFICLGLSAAGNSVNQKPYVPCSVKGITFCTASSCSGVNEGDSTISTSFAKRSVAALLFGAEPAGAKHLIASIYLQSNAAS